MIPSMLLNFHDQVNKNSDCTKTTEKNFYRLKLELEKNIST